MILLANGKVITRDPEGIGYLPDGGVVTAITVTVVCCWKLL